MYPLLLFLPAVILFLSIILGGDSKEFFFKPTPKIVVKEIAISCLRVDLNKYERGIADASKPTLV